MFEIFRPVVYDERYGCDDANSSMFGECIMIFGYIINPNEELPVFFGLSDAIGKSAGLFAVYYT